MAAGVRREVRTARAAGAVATERDGVDVLGLTRRHLAGLDDRQAELARQRERVRAVEARLLTGDRPSDV